jgi:FHA domain
MADAVPRRGQKCAKGHSMDPGWDKCPYCEAEQKSNQKSGMSTPVESADRQRTRVDSGAPIPPQANRVTRTISAPSPGGHVADDARRIVGVLVTYTWRREGELFAVRAGKNFIGRGQISSEPHHRDCDIQVPQDGEMSEEHALILCRQGGYEILDQATSNGTFLNSQALKANLGTDLPNYATIKTGATLWTFVRIDIPETVEETSHRAEREPEAKAAAKKSSGDTTVG